MALTFRARRAQAVEPVTIAQPAGDVDVAAPYRPIVTALLDRLHEHHPASAQHSQRVAALSEMAAATMRLDVEDLEEVRLVGLLHDVGKLYVPSQLLDKPTRPSGRELRLLRAHSTYSAQLVSEHGLSWLAAAVASIHERVDGAGYPGRLRGSEISLSSRLVAVCDAYDAMTSHRSYRRALTSTQAIREICRCAGRQFDAACVASFIAALAGGY